MNADAIATIRALCDTLSSADVSVEGVAASLGEIVEDQGGKLGVIVRPSDPQFAEATIVRAQDSGAPAHVRLSLADPQGLSTSALVEAFGSYTMSPKKRPGPARNIVFYDERPGRPITCAIIAELSPGPAGVDGGAAQSVTVRRDAHQS
jgi:hypothetical protein